MTHFYLTFVKDVKSGVQTHYFAWVFISSCYCNNYHKFGGLKLQKFIPYSFELGIQYAFWGCCSLEIPNRKSFPCVSSFRRTPEFLSSQLLPPSSKQQQEVCSNLCSCFLSFSLILTLLSPSYKEDPCDYLALSG